MTKEELDSLHGLLVLKKILDDRMARLKNDIAKLRDRQSVTTLANYQKLMELKRKREKESARLACEVEEAALAIEAALRKEWHKFTPLEAIVMEKIYVDGLNWKEFKDFMYTDERFSTMYYDMSGYFRAHRSALDKLGIPKTKRGGVRRVQKMARNKNSV